MRLLRIPFRLLAVLWRLGVGYWTIRVRFAALNNAERSDEVQRWASPFTWKVRRRSMGP